MKILDQYILKDIIPPLGLGLSVFTFVLLMGRVLQLMETIITNRMPIKMVILLILYLLPSLMIFIIPMALLFALLMLYGRMSADNEIMAFRAAGLSLYRLMVPAVILSFFLFVATLSISCLVIPEGNKAFRRLVLDATWKNATLALQEKTFNNVGEDLIIYVENISGSSLRRVIVSDQRKPEDTITIFAQRGELTANDRLMKLILRLKEGTIHRTNPDNVREYQQLSFSTYDILLSGSRTEERRSVIEMSLGELRREIDKQKKIGRRPSRLLIEFYQRFSIPFACVVFTLLGCSLGIQNRKTSRFSGFGLSLIVILGYYTLLALGKSLVYSQWLPAGLAMWTPNILLLMLGGAFLYRLE